MLQSCAIVPTAHASRYLQQLCKHWSHKFQTEFTADAGRIALPLGEARLAAEADALTIDLKAKDDADLAVFKDVVAQHVERFAFQENLVFEWS
ncbi:DUF2218 domain-containing protein [Aurantimonas endophytica]|uniref:DUF2218 domain-containing protein n=1 Tax=Aurantimonas endophytica TaxID=1522175 RepID=A0A7W6H9P9_9HYPH|nr:DUF2218 domain-containing protein [Aurantimonas endophytica]MBB4001209.1 hypothetical protein [Aurantimonas endophytica]MCO6403141.1 DUF2218 domain-containing protein [Aurantimonas endophytica]